MASSAQQSLPAALFEPYVVPESTAASNEQFKEHPLIDLINARNELLEGPQKFKAPAWLNSVPGTLAAVIVGSLGACAAILGIGLALVAIFGTTGAFIAIGATLASFVTVPFWEKRLIYGSKKKRKLFAKKLAALEEAIAERLSTESFELRPSDVPGLLYGHIIHKSTSQGSRRFELHGVAEGKPRLMELKLHEAR